MISKKYIPLIVGVAFAIIGVYLLTLYLDQREKRFQGKAVEAIRNLQKNQVALFIAKTSIPMGTAITPDLLDTQVFLKSKAPSEAVRFVNELDGMEAARYLKAGEPITKDALRVSHDAFGGRSLSTVIPQGKRALQLKVENIAAIVKMLRPGDHVDIEGIIPVGMQGGQQQILNVLLFQDVLVLAVGDQFGASKDETTSFNLTKFFTSDENKKAEAKVNPLITVAVEPQEASIISFVQEQGKIRLMLRGQLDTAQQALPPVTAQSFMQFLVSRGILSAPQEQVPEEEKDTIEIYRGLKKDTMELRK